MSTLETRIAEVLAAHRYDPEGGVCTCSNEVQVGLRCDDLTHAQHIAAVLAPVIAKAKAEALKAEAANLRELHTLIEDTPWNPMPAEDKTRCINFMDESGVDDHEYTDRHLNNYADWLDHRAKQIRSNDE